MFLRENPDSNELTNMSEHDKEMMHVSGPDSKDQVSIETEPTGLSAIVGAVEARDAILANTLSNTLKISPEYTTLKPEQQKLIRATIDWAQRELSFIPQYTDDQTELEKAEARKVEELYQHALEAAQGQA